MARIVGGSMIGELSGKLGGNVFARNKSGQYVRSYAVPVDPNTLAQQGARNSFGYASSSYHAMTPAQKTAWGTFASGAYLPKNGANTGQFSGFNAFVALNNAANNAARLNINDITVEINNTPATIITTAPFAPTQVAPSLSVQANLKTSAGAPVPLFLTPNSAVYTDGTFQASIDLGSGVFPVPTTLTSQLQDGNDNPVGFMFYLSSGNQQRGMFFANPEIYCLGSVQNITLPGTTNVGVTTIDFIGGVINPAEYQSFPTEGQAVLLSGYIVTLDGQMIRFGSIELDMETP